MRADTQQSYKQRILRVLIYIQEHLGEPMALDELAGLAHFSPFHFHRIFRGMVGESVKEHVRRLRLERAAHQLKFTLAPVTSIAFDAGYEAHESFTRAFGEMFGQSPSEFRAQHRSMHYPNVPSGIHYVSDTALADFHAPVSGGSAMEVRIEKVLPMRVAFMRHVGPFDQVGATWGKLMAWAGPRGLLGPHMKMIGLIPDDPDVTPADKLRYDACLVVGNQTRPEGEIGVQEIAGGDYAVTTHRGPYEQLGSTYARLCGEWLPASGREVRSVPVFEIYRNSPQFSKPEDLLTDIYLPLETVGA